jgi:hypothetical protein
MKSKILGFLTVGLLAGPMAANAVPVTWSVVGTITGVTSGPSGVPYFPAAVVGDPFEVLLSFNTDAVLQGTNTGNQFAPGARYRYDPSSIQFSVRVGASGPVNFAYGPEFASGSFLYLLDNTGYASSGVPWDGISFGLQTAGANPSIGLSMRGAILDIVNGPGLPVTPDPRLADLDQTFFQISVSGGEGGSLVGEITSVSSAPKPVPEPGTLVLLGLGLAGLGLSRRRKTH